MLYTDSIVTFVELHDIELHEDALQEIHITRRNKDK